MFTFNTVTVALALALLTNADPKPTSPFSTSVFNQGTTCTIQWDADPTGVWNPMNIELMTGPNLNMVHLSTVAQNIDGTDASNTTFSYPCLKVTPNSAIYFYQFTSPKSSNVTWTTRFTLAGPNGETTPPANATQPGSNDPIPWGTGALVDPSQDVPAPVRGGANGSSVAPSGTPSSIPTSSALPISTPSQSLPLSFSSRPASSSSAAVSSSSAPAPTSSGAASSFFPSQAIFAAPLLALLSFL